MLRFQLLMIESSKVPESGETRVSSMEMQGGTESGEGAAEDGERAVAQELIANLTIQNEVLLEGARMASLGAWEYDVTSLELQWSPGVFEIFDLVPGEPPSLEEGLDYFIPGHRADIKSKLEASVTSGGSFDINCELISAKGKHKFVRIMGRGALFRNRKMKRMMGVIQDVTSSYKLRRDMEAFFQLTPDFVGSVDFDGKALTLNPSWTSTLGWTAGDLKQEGLSAVVCPEDRPRMQKLLREVIHSARIEKIENRVLSKRGTMHWFSWRIFADKTTETVFISARDVSDRKEAEKALIEAKIQAEEANQAKSDFLAVMSHELRTPLNPILGFTDLLMEEIENPEHREVLAAISDAGEILTSVIGDVLDFAKIESGRSDVHADVFDLRRLVERQVGFMAGQIKNDTVRLDHTFEVNKRLPESASYIGDEEKIARVLSNLLGNAIKFTDNGAIHLDCSVDPIDTDRAMLHVDITDSGIGIAEETLDELFKPFRQADSSRTRRHGGAGLGLAICKKLVELMGGQMTARSQLGKGSTFSFVLPLSLPPASATPAETVKRSGGASALLIKDAPHILLVEDNATNTFYAKRLLAGMGCPVTAVSSGEEALAQYSPDDHAVILLDLHMPGIGGMEVLRTVRAQELESGAEHQPILILTADVLPTTREACLKNGASGVLNKPVRAMELKAAIEGALKIIAAPRGR